MNVVFMGTPLFAVPSLQVLIQNCTVSGVVTQPDRPKGRKRVLTAPPVKEVAGEHGIPILQPSQMKEDRVLRQLVDWKPDLIVTAAFGQFLPKSVLDLPILGCINVHASLLPKYRGGAPVHYAIMNGERETGVTLMYMAKRMDAGDIIAQRVTPIHDEDDVGTMFEKLSEVGATLLQEMLPKIQTGDIEAVPQNEAEATYAPNITTEVEKIDWEKPAHDVWNHIRGLHPFPVAFSTLEGKRLKIYRAKKGTSTNKVVGPGTITDIDREGIHIQCGDGKTVILQELQLSGKKRMDAQTFLQGAGSHLQPGTCLGVNE